MHGLDNDPKFKELKKEFINNYRPDIKQFSKVLLNKGQTQKSIDDMYIRGWLSPDSRDEFRKRGDYSIKQIEILNKMQNYIRNGQ